VNETVAGRFAISLATRQGDLVDWSLLRIFVSAVGQAAHQVLALFAPDARKTTLGRVGPDRGGQGRIQVSYLVGIAKSPSVSLGNLSGADTLATMILLHEIALLFGSKGLYFRSSAMDDGWAGWY
jgi:hypothetical protein